MKKSTHNKDEISVAVIAGGRSRRFGTDKATAFYRENQLINIAIQTGYNISPEVFLVMRSTSEEKNLFPPVIADIIPDCGPMGGICTALFYSKNPYVCIMPCDMPLLKQEIYEILIKFRDINKPVVARSVNGPEPLVSIWPKTLAEILYSYLVMGNYRLRMAMKDLEAIEIDLSEEWNSYNEMYFSNINYREDLEKLNRLH